MRAFNGDLSYVCLMDTYNECCFGNVHPTEIRVGPETFTKVMAFTKRLVNFQDAVFRPYRDLPEDVLHFYVPYNDSKYGAILCLKGEWDGSTAEQF